MASRYKIYVDDVHNNYSNVHMCAIMIIILYHKWFVDEHLGVGKSMYKLQDYDFFNL